LGVGTEQRGGTPLRTRGGYALLPPPLADGNGDQLAGPPLPALRVADRRAPRGPPVGGRGTTPRACGAHGRRGHPRARACVTRGSASALPDIVSACPSFPSTCGATAKRGTATPPSTSSPAALRGRASGRTGASSTCPRRSSACCPNGSTAVTASSSAAAPP